MYAIAIVRYRQPMEAIEKVLAEHREYLKGLQAQGILLASGPVEPRSGGIILLRVPDDDSDAALTRVRDEDPFTREGLAQYELLPWKPVFGTEGLDKL